MADGMPDPPGSGSTRVRGPRIVVRYTKVRVEVVRGPDAGRSVEVAGQSVTIGTAEDRPAGAGRRQRLARPLRARARHGRDARTRSRMTNGVFAGETRLYDAVLPFDSRLRLGDTELALSALAETVEREQTTRDRFGDLLGASPRMRELFADSSASRPPTSPCSSRGRPERARRSWRSRCTGRAHAQRGRSWSSTAARSPRRSSRASFSATSAAPSPERRTPTWGVRAGRRRHAVPRRDRRAAQELQPKLLRAIEKREIRRVGGTRVIPFDTRVIAATNRQLRAEVARDQFRQDLYFRLAAAHVTVPALRERMEDLPLLVERFLSLERPPQSARDLSPELWDLLRAHRWPGNVRELRNVVQRFLVTPDRALRDLTVASPVAAGPRPRARACSRCASRAVRMATPSSASTSPRCSGSQAAT